MENPGKGFDLRDEQKQKILNHNKTIEINLIENELLKFRQEITKKRPPKVKKVKIPENPYTLLDNAEIFSSLATTEEKTNDFYRKIIKAPIESAKIFDKTEELCQVEPLLDAPANSRKDLRSASVQFEDNVKIIEYPKDELEEKSDESDSESIFQENSFFGMNFRDDHQIISCCEEITTTTKSYFTFHSFTSSPSQESDFGSSSTHESTESSIIFNQDEDLEASFLAEALKTISQDSEKAKESDESPNGELIVRQLLPEKRVQEEVKVVEAPGENAEVSPEKLKIISELFREHSEAYKEFREILLRKYFLKWIHYTTVEKVSKCKSIASKNDRIGKIDAYLNKIRDEKRRVGRKEHNPEGEEAKKPAPKEESIIMAKKYRSK